jgi:hypothetical protein
MYDVITVTMKKEEKTRGIAVNRIWAERMAKKIILFCNIKESTVYESKGNAMHTLLPELPKCS